MATIPDVFRDSLLFPVHGDKTPAVKWKNYQGGVSADQKAYGINLGPSGLVVIDTDRHSSVDGEAEFQNIVREMSLPDTLTVHTPTGGYHRFYRTDGEIRNSASKIAKSVDVRGTGGYVVGAGSTTNDGTYSIVDYSPISFLPPDLEELLQYKKEESKIAPTRHFVDGEFATIGKLDKYQRAALESAMRNVSTAYQGTRNNTLNKEVYGLVSIGISPDDIRDNLLPVCGLEHSEAITTFNSAMRAGMENPRSYSLTSGYVFTLNQDFIESVLAQHQREEAARNGISYHDKKHVKIREQSITMLRMVTISRLAAYKTSFSFSYDEAAELMGVGKRRLQTIFSLLRDAGVVETIVEPRSPRNGVPGVKPVYKVKYDYVKKVDIEL